jgi:hypothetical protein
MQRLRKARGLAWPGLVPAFDHAIALAREAEFVAAHASNLAQCGVDPAYPPLVELLAASIDDVPLSMLADDWEQVAK